MRNFKELTLKLIDFNSISTFVYTYRLLYSIKRKYLSIIKNLFVGYEELWKCSVYRCKGSVHRSDLKD